MCGILATINTSNDENLFKKALGLLAHRGPDNISYGKINDNIFFGHCRLSILDLSSKANQPMSFNGVYLIYNGEIYNYNELKQILLSAGITLKTTSDTEIIIKLYYLMGYDFIKLLNGMFAFCIFDKNKNELIFCRDRFGIKPLYIYNKNNSLILSSEVKPILKIIDKYELNNEVLPSLFATNFLFGNETLFKDINNVQPGIIFVYNGTKEKEQIKFNNYVNISLINDMNNVINKNNENEISDFVFTLLYNSISSQTISDVPISIFLSAGFDSSIIAHILYQKITYKINSYTFSNPNSIHDESILATKLATHYGFNHNNIIIDLDNDYEKLFYDCTYYFEFPIPYIACLPLFILSKNASSYNKVVLTGEGGDELFGGYNKYQNVFKISYRLFFFFLRLLFGEKTAIEKIGYYLSVYSKSKNLSNIKFNFKFAKYSKIDLLSEDYFTNILIFDQKNYLQGMLQKSDRMTMANSLEARVPFLDNNLVFFCNMLDYRYKIRNKTQKYLLKKIASKILPSDYLNAPKRGFPVTKLANKMYEQKNFIIDKFLNSNINKELSNKNEIKTLINFFKRTNIDYSTIWIMNSFIDWYYIYFEEKNFLFNDRENICINNNINEI